MSRCSNPGCLLDEHKRQDSIFLRGLLLVKKNARLRAIKDLHLTVNRLHHRQALDPSVDLSSAIASEKATLSVKLEESVQLASRRKFASDIQATERCSRFFFDHPKFSTNHLSLWTRRTIWTVPVLHLTSIGLVYTARLPANTSMRGLLGTAWSFIGF